MAIQDTAAVIPSGDLRMARYCSLVGERKANHDDVLYCVLLDRVETKLYSQWSKVVGLGR